MNFDALIGKPWRAMACGPAEFDCWGLAREGAAALFGLAWPETIYQAAHDWPQRSREATAYLSGPAWRERDTAAPGRVLALCDYAGHVRHVALCLDATRALHTSRATRSCVLPIAKLRRVYPVARFYEWAP